MKNPALSGGVFHNNTVEQKHWPLTRVFQATRATHLVVERCARSSGRTRYFDSSHDAITPGWSAILPQPRTRLKDSARCQCDH
jgi:hypothetical protein